MDIRSNIEKVLTLPYFRPDSLPEYRMRFTKKSAAAYLAGMIDGEGSIEYAPPPQSVRTLKITNTDENLLQVCREAYDILGITHWTKQNNRRHETNLNWNPCYDLCVSGKSNLVKIKELIPIQHSKKRERLEEALSTYKYNVVPALDGFKVCSKCKNELPLSSFWLRSDRPGQRVSQCKQCKSERVIWT